MIDTLSRCFIFFVVVSWVQCAEECKKNSDVLRSDPQDSNRYYKCLASSWVHMSCYPGMIYNNVRQRCETLHEHKVVLNVTTQRTASRNDVIRHRVDVTGKPQTVKHIVLNLKPLYPIQLNTDVNSGQKPIILTYDDPDNNTVIYGHPYVLPPMQQTTTRHSSTSEDWSSLVYDIDPRGAVDIGANTAPIPELLPTDCGRSLRITEDKIYGGAMVSVYSYPWQASLRYKSNGRHFCGATVISNEYLVSAAHCFKNGLTENHFFVRVGDTRLEERDGTEVDFFVKKLYKHRKFRKVPNNRNDIALVKLKNKLKFGLGVQPVCLPQRYDEREEDSCVISGWGRTETEIRISNHLRAALVPILKRNVCLTKYKDRAMSRGMFCAGVPQGGVDTCQGDSGGPLVCPRNGRYTLFGVTSWGVGCGDGSRPGVYTRVAMYRKWIEAKMSSPHSDQEYEDLDVDDVVDENILSRDPQEYVDEDILD